MKPSERLWRSLIRVHEIDYDNEILYIIIPGWNPQVKIELNFKDIPERIIKLIRPGKRFHAKVNIGVESEKIYCLMVEK